jgi:hypothetical protein
LKVEEWEVVTDNNAAVSMIIPLEKQKEYYIVENPLTNKRDTVGALYSASRFVEFQQ